ncbi:MAG TPA: thiamine-phosphate kinase, partial [Dissulfurispiraceae bacterium]|nr:thiamine-phosphate kinase [Dissulfurispiraceae bacterium]
ELSFFDAFFDGIAAACERYGIALLGGDMSGVRHDLFVSATVIGEGTRFVARKGAHPGDNIYVTGCLGDSACGLAVLQKLNSAGQRAVLENTSCIKPAQGDVFLAIGMENVPWGDVEPLLMRHLMPTARSSAAIAPYASAMIDISDGLFIDVSRLCDESGVGAEVWAASLPLSSSLCRIAPLLGKDALTFAVAGGEDYELLFTSSAPPAELHRASSDVPITCIGVVTDAERAFVVVDGMRQPLVPQGYDHFRAEQQS